MIKLPFYAMSASPVILLAPNTTVHMMEIVEFLKWTVESDQLEIANYLAKMKEDPFFLVAATGLGKTVGVPVHVLIRQIQRSGRSKDSKARVWVIEPRIPIAIEQAEYMNRLWDQYRVKQSKTHSKTKPLFGCITSASGSVNPDAPIQFVTTGIFEMYTREGKFDPINDRVIIDEAHVTVEQNPGVELGIALCRRAGITVDYMSATVDVTGLEEALGVQTIIRADKVRNIVWKSNLLKPIIETISDLVEGTLVSPKCHSSYFPADDYRDAKIVTDSALELGRSHGMLVVVNSFNGDTSDIRKLTNKLRESHPTVPVLHLASDVVRDPQLQAEFKNRLSSIESRQENYVIMSTSVVEMGITFPTLDYVVTMDSGYDQETIGDVSFPVVAPLGVNSLLQRIGRVGRKRPGIAYISNEVGADYSSLEDAPLNNNALAYEPIRYPLSSAPLMTLAYYAAQQEWDDLDTWLTDLKLPSKIQEDEGRMEFFHEQFEKLEILGITKDGKLTELGVRMDQWIGRADIAYATQLQQRFADGASREEVLFWIVATALSTTSANSLKAQYGHFVDFDGSHKEIANRIDVWSGMSHEDVALFRVIAEISDLAPGYFWDKAKRTVLSGSSFYRWSNWAGLDARKFVKAGQSITDTVMLFSKVNGKSPEFDKMFGKASELKAATIDWMSVYKKLPVKVIEKQLAKLVGTTKIVLAYNEAMNAFEWLDEAHGHEGLISQDNTPIRLDESMSYAARITPSRETRGDAASWRVTSLGVLPAPGPRPQRTVVTVKEKPTPPTPKKVVTKTPVAPAPAKKKSFLDRLFGR